MKPTHCETKMREVFIIGNVKVLDNKNRIEKLQDITLYQCDVCKHIEVV